MDGAAWLVRRPANDAGPPATARIGTGADMQEEGPGRENEMRITFVSLFASKKFESERKERKSTVVTQLLYERCSMYSGSFKEQWSRNCWDYNCLRELSESERVRKEKKNMKILKFTTFSRIQQLFLSGSRFMLALRHKKK